MRYAYGVDEASIMGMDKSRGESDFRLSLRAVEFHILLSLAAGERHGYGIILDIQARGMAENGLIAAAARRPAADAGDERRNYYRITDAGVRAARAEVRRLEALMRAARIGGLLGKAAK
jgi:DNA-binding PadR family transcriptional regulator